MVVVWLEEEEKVEDKISSRHQQRFKMKSKQILLAAVQNSPVSFDLQASLDKVEKLTKEAAEKARGLVKDQVDTPVVVVFPEAFLSAYPRGYDVGVHSKSLLKRIGKELSGGGSVVSLSMNSIVLRLTLSFPSPSPLDSSEQR